MRLVTFHDDAVADHERIGVVDGEHVRDVTDVVAAVHLPGRSLMKTVVTRYDELSGALRDVSATGASRALATVVLRPPVPDPTKVVAAPVNYVDHMHEMSATHHVSSLGIFLKAPSSLIGADGTVQLPYTDRRFDQEGELALVVGRTARHVSEDDALDYVFGYTCLLDITMRGGEDRSTRKSFETFTPLGPWIVTADEIDDPAQLTLECSVNDAVRQSAPIKDLIWNVQKLLAYASSVTTLHPGDIITTGTPQGVGSLHDGDEIAVTISDIGTLRVGVSADGAVECPTSGARSGPVPPAERPR